MTVAGYYRISKARDDMVAPELYEAEIRRYCEYKKLQLHEPLFSDIGISGRAESRHLRKGLDELVARRREFSAIITPRLNRFGRSLKDLSETFQVLDDDGVALIFLDVEVNTRTPTGRLVRNMLASLAEWESDRIGEYWQDVLANARKAGRYTGTKPYGYIYDLTEHQLIPDEEASTVVREIFERYAHGETASAIARDLNERGIPFRRFLRDKDGSLRKTYAKSKGFWGPDSVLRIVTNPVYVGRQRVGIKENPGAWKTLVELTTFDVCVARREREQSHRPRYGKGAHLLSGLLVCGVCEKPLHYLKRKKHDLYACRNMVKGGRFDDRCRGGGIRASTTEKFVLDALFERLGADRMQIPPAKKTTGTHLQDRLAEVERRMKAVVDRLLDTTGPGMDETMRREGESLEREQADLLSAIQENVLRERDEQEQLAWIGPISHWMEEEGLLEEGSEMTPEQESRYWSVLGWADTDLAQQRQLLQRVIDHVVMVPTGNPRKKEILIEWKT